jgi:hypothetical protein
MLNPKSLQSQSGNGSPYSWFRFWFFRCSVRQFMQDMSGKSPLYKKCVLNPFTFQCVLSLYEEWCFCNWSLSHFLLLAAFRLLCTVPCLSTHEWILSTCVAGPMCFLAHQSVVTCCKLSRVTNQFFHELLLFERYKKSCYLACWMPAAVWYLLINCYCVSTYCWDYVQKLEYLYSSVQMNLEYLTIDTQVLHCCCHCVPYSSLL